MEISIIAAVGKNLELGYQKKLPWHIPEDLKNFKQITMNHYILCGRKTYLSIGKVLPNRTMLILTHKKDFIVSNGNVVHSVKEALLKAKEAGEKELFVIGGGHVYNELLPHTTKIYLSEINWKGKADTFFPKLDPSNWNLLQEKAYPKKINSPDWIFKILTRKRCEKSE